jgi:hypothetical protein
MGRVMEPTILSAKVMSKAGRKGMRGSLNKVTTLSLAETKGHVPARGTTDVECH